MGQIPMKQPDGQWCIFSTVVDDFLIEDATREEVKQHMLEREEERIDRHLDEVEEGKRPRFKGYEQAVRQAKRRKKTGEGGNQSS